MSNAFLDALGWLGSSLDKPGAAVRGLLAGRPEQLLNLLPFSDTLGITDPSQRTRGSDLLGLDPDTLGGTLGGMAAEVATDPLNLLLGAGLARNVLRGRSLQEGYRGAQAGAEAIEAGRAPLLEAAGRAEASNALRRELLGTGGMPEEVAMQTKAVDAAGQPVRTYHGTPQVYEQFDPALDRGHNLYGPGYYSTESPGIASGYAGGAGYNTIFDRDQAFLTTEKMLERLGEKHGVPGGMLSWERAQALHPDLPMPPLTGQLPRSRIPALVREWEKAGIPIDDLFQSQLRQPHLRTQLLDYRNPLDLTRTYTPAEANELSARLGGGPVFEANAPPALQHPGEALWDDLRFAVSDARGFPLSTQMDPKDFNALLAEQGFDAIRHIGGGNTGNLPHQVHIVFGPQQIYKPWVAPLEQALPILPPPAAIPLPPTLPRQSPLLGALGLQNLLGRAG